MAAAVRQTKELNQLNGMLSFQSMKYRRFGRTELAMPVLSCEFDYVNLHWYFVNDLNWSAIPEARRRDMGVFIISPNDKGGKLHEPPQKLLELCAPLTPMHQQG